MRHEDLSLLEESVRAANPIPRGDELVESDASARVLLMVREQTNRAESPDASLDYAQAPSRGWLRPALVFLTASVIVIASFGILALMRSEPADVVEEPNPVTTTATIDIAEDAATYEVQPFTGVELPPSLAPALNSVLDLAFAPDGSLWAATSGGVVRWDVESGTPTIFTDADGLQGSWVNGIDVAPDGTVWVASADWVARYDGTWTSYTEFGDIEYVRINLGTVVARPGGEAWFWADMTPDTGLLHFDGATWTAVAAPGGWLVVDDLWAGMAFSLDSAPDGTLWVGSDNGVLAYNGVGWTHYTPTNSDLPSLMTPWIANAPDGTVWVGTEPLEGDIVRDAIAAAGVAAFDGSAWTTYTTAEGLPSDKGKVAVGPDGTVWAMADEGISRFGGTDWTSISVRGHGYGSTVGPDGTLWQPTPVGISGFDESAPISLVVSPDAAPRDVADRALIPAGSPITTPTAIGDITWYRFEEPVGHGLGDIEVTPYGLVAVDGTIVRWSTDLLNWRGAALPIDAWRITADENRVIAHRAAAVWLRWDEEAWFADEILELGERPIDQVVVGDRGTVIVSGLEMFHAPRGRNFVRVEDSPQPPQLADDWSDPEHLVGCLYGSVGSGEPGFGPVLATASGFVALAPAHPATWSKAPLCEPVLWSSSDGTSWEQLSAETPFGRRSVIVGVASHAGRHVAVGAANGVDTIWISEDGLNWIAIDPPDEMIDPTAVSGSEHGWILLEDNGKGWVSADGVTWAPIAEDMPATRTFWVPQTISMGHGLIAVSGTEELVFGVLEE